MWTIGRHFEHSDCEAWQAEYQACVRVRNWNSRRAKKAALSVAKRLGTVDLRWREDWDEYVSGDQPFEEAEYGYRPRLFLTDICDSKNLSRPNG